MNKNRFHIKVLNLLLLVMFILACEKQTEWELKTLPQFLVVDALLTNEFKAQKILVYHSASSLNGSNQPFSSATISVTNGQQTYSFTESVNESGTYYSEPFRATAGFDYSLIVNYLGKSDTAQAAMVPISPLQTDGMQPVNGLYNYVYSGSGLPAMTEVYYNWSVVPDYCEEYGSCEASETFYTLTILDIAKEFAPEKQEIFFPFGTTIIRRKYSLSEAHQQFIHALLIETEWRGGLFDTEQGNVPTNFRHGTRGWFAVCMVLTDTSRVE